MDINTILGGNIADFVGILIVGSALSLVLEYFSRKFGPTSGKMRAITIVGSIVVGGAYVFVRSTSWFPTIVTVLTAASAFYALILKK